MHYNSKLIIFLLTTYMASISVILCGCPFLGDRKKLTGNLYKTAIEINSNRAALNRQLQDQYNIAASQPDGRLFREFNNASVVNSSLFRNTRIMLEFERLIKDAEKIDAKDLQCILDQYAANVPIEKRCTLLNTKCDPNDKYRSLDGLCNNLKHPKWGSAGVTYGYFETGAYSDGIRDIRRAHLTKFELPNPRIIGNMFEASNYWEMETPNDRKLCASYKNRKFQAFNQNLNVPHRYRSQLKTEASNNHKHHDGIRVESQLDHKHFTLTKHRNEKKTQLMEKLKLVDETRAGKKEKLATKYKVVDTKKKLSGTKVMKKEDSVKKSNNKIIKVSEPIDEKKPKPQDEWRPSSFSGLRKLESIEDDDHKFYEQTKHEQNPIPNVLGVLFGQFIAHDQVNRNIVQLRGDFANASRCCTNSRDTRLPPEHTTSDCIPILHPHNDPIYASKHFFCQSFIRTQPVFDNDCRLTHSKPQNLATSFLDMSAIYDVSRQLSNNLRTFSGGLMRTDRQNILPQRECEAGETAPCYETADSRGTQTPHLSVMHSLLSRQHNDISNNLAKMNPKWNDNKLFKESRRLNIALYQHIIYNEWLEVFIGKHHVGNFKLKCGKSDETCNKYDKNLDASSTVEYANGAFRIYHENVPTSMEFYDSSYKFHKEMKVSDLINGLSYILSVDYNKILRGMMIQKMRHKKRGYSNEIRSLLFKVNETGIDQMMLDIMRSRDTGVQPYYKFFIGCQGIHIKEWCDLEPFMTKSSIKLLMSIYDSVFDIDLIVGILVEEKKYGHAGVISACLIAEQFRRQKFGDRFFYSISDNPHRFSSEQMNEIESYSMARLVCAHSGVTKVPQTAFLPPSRENPWVACNTFPSFNFDVFKAKK